MRISSIFDCDDEVKKPRLFWFFLIGTIWMIWIASVAGDVYDKTKAEVDAKASAEHYSSLQVWWHSNDASQAEGTVIWRGILALIPIFIVAPYIAKAQADFMYNAARRRRESQARRGQEAFETQIKEMDQANQQQTNLSKLAQSKKVLIVRLGNIDRFIRALHGQGNSASRTMALQDAQTEITKLAANLVSGDISREAISDPEVQEHALETSRDLTQHGLAEDRLNRDIIRIFKLNAE